MAGKRIDGNLLLQCKTAYLADETKSVADIAIDFKVNPRTLGNWAGREKWSETRKTIKQRNDKRIVAEIERNVPREIVKVIKQRILHGSAKALDTLELVIDGKAGKGAYNRLLASKEWLYMGGFKAPDQLDVKVSKVSDMLERVSVSVSEIKPIDVEPLAITDRAISNQSSADIACKVGEGQAVEREAVIDRAGLETVKGEKEGV